MPSQGYITDTGVFEGLIETNRGDLRGCYWTAERSGYYGTMIQFQPVPYVSLSYNKYTHGVNDTGNIFGYNIIENFYVRYPSNVTDVTSPYASLLYHRLNVPLLFRDYVASRGQNVRCIQEPNN